MEPEVLEVIDNAVKILGPALITGLVGYFSARIQFAARLKELDKNNEFKAREYFFRHYKERQKLAASGAAQEINRLSKLMSGLKLGRYDEADEESLQNVRAFIAMNSEPYMIMVFHKLEGKPQLVKLLAARDNVDVLASNNQNRPTVEYIAALIEFLQVFDLCVDLIAEENMKYIFGKYIHK